MKADDTVSVPETGRSGAMLRSTLIIAGLVLIGRVTGFGREWLIALRGGASETTDIAIVLLTFPDLMVSLLLSGGLAATLVPAFKRLPPGGDTALLLQTARLVGGLFLLLALVLAALAPLVLAFLAPGLPRDVLLPHANAFRVMTLALPLAALSGVVVALLNANGRFAIGASGTLVFNLAVIVCLLFADTGTTVPAIAAGVTGGALLRLSMQTAGLRRDWRPPSTRGNLIDRDLIRQFLGSFSFITILVALPPLARAISSFADAGALSLFNYAYKLVELPMGVVIGSISTVLLPRLAADLAESGHAGAQANLAAGIRATVGISVGIAIPAAFFSDTLVQLAFFKASFTPEQIDALSTLAAVGFASLPFQGLLTIYGSAFAAGGHTRPLVATAFMMLVSIAVIAPLARNWLGLPGVMAAYAGVYLMGAAYLSWQACRRFGADTLSIALYAAPKTLMLPALAATAVAALGHGSSEGLAARAIWACAAFAAFAAGTWLLDDRLRSRFARSGKESTR